MNHQLASFLNKYGSIDVYDRGLLITFTGLEPIYLGGEMVVHFDLFLTFMELRCLGLAQSFEGDVARQGIAPGDGVELGTFSILTVGKRKYEVRTVSSTGIEQRVVIGRQFLHCLLEAMKHWFDSMKDNSLLESYRSGRDWWFIAGKIDNTPLKYRINRHSLVIEVPQNFDGQERYYVFSSEADDYELWMEALYKARRLLKKSWKEGSWINVLAADDKSIRVELEDGQVYLSLYDPDLAELNISLGSNLEMLNFLRRLLKVVWQEEAEMSAMEELFIDEDD